MRAPVSRSRPLSCLIRLAILHHPSSDASACSASSRSGDDHVKAATEEDGHAAVSKADPELGLVARHAARAAHVILPAIST